jgi:heme-degrading monooxygenase HmoA
MTDAFAKLPPPPYYAVVFSSQRREGDNGYGATSDRMVELAQEQPGFLGVESTRGEDGFGITVAYWDSEASIKAWRLHLEHTAARERGRAEWYRHFELRIAKVERAYGWDLDTGYRRPSADETAQTKETAK